MDYLDKLESRTIFIIREAYHEFKNIAMLWSIGKDSTSLLWMVRKAFFGKIPFPIIHIDTSYKIPEIYSFRDKYAKEWNLNLIISRNEEAIKNGVSPDKGRFECCNALKTEALKQTIKKYGFKALLLGIRRDEHGIRAKERVFCFPPSTLIYGKENNEIKKIKQGDYVFTHTGKLRKVLGVSKRNYSDKLIEIKPAYGMPILSSHNHPYLSKKTRGSGKFIKYKLESFDGKVYEGETEITGKAANAWIPASEVKKGDWIFIPKLSLPKKNKIHKIDISKIIDFSNGIIIKNKRIYYKSAHSDHAGVPQVIKLNPSLARIFGYYIAEGSFNARSNQVSFAFSKKEKSLINDTLKTIKNSFGIDGHVRTRDNSSEVLFSSKVLGLLFAALFNKGAKNKNLPSFFLHLNKKNLQELIKGCWLGDGSNERYSTRSSKLAYQIRIALLSLGILTSIRIKSKRESKQRIIEIVGHSKKRFGEMIGIKSKVKFVDRLKLVREVKETPRVEKKGPHLTSGGFWIKVKSVKSMAYTGKLYNLEVESDGTYLAEGIAVHNSPRNQEFKWDYKNQPPELWDQFKSRSDDNSHIRVHPLLHWTELDIWKYVQRERIPITNLYFAKNGKRYRSLGCLPCCSLIDSNASSISEIVEELKTTRIAERSGRAQDKERAYMMQKLRSLGYM